MQAEHNRADASLPGPRVGLEEGGGGASARNGAARDALEPALAVRVEPSLPVGREKAEGRPPAWRGPAREQQVVPCHAARVRRRRGGQARGEGVRRAGPGDGGDGGPAALLHLRLVPQGQAPPPGAPPPPPPATGTPLHAHSRSTRAGKGWGGRDPRTSPFTPSPHLKPQQSPYFPPPALTPTRTDAGPGPTPGLALTDPDSSRRPARAGGYLLPALPGGVLPGGRTPTLLLRRRSRGRAGHGPRRRAEGPAPSSGAGRRRRGRTVPVPGPPTQAPPADLEV